jgi:hypothetical protein
MKAAPNRTSFMRLTDRALPEYGENYELLLMDEETGEPL